MSGIRLDRRKTSKTMPIILTVIFTSTIAAGVIQQAKMMKLVDELDTNKKTMHSLELQINAEKTNKKGQNTNEDVSYSLAKKHSFGFFDDIKDENWKKMQYIVGKMVDHKFPEQPIRYLPLEDGSWEGYFKWYQTNYEPNFSCAFEDRIGGNGNGYGPKWVCDPHRIKRISKERMAKNSKSKKPGCVVYSIGSKCDFQFELGLQRTLGVGTCEYHRFDNGDYEKCIPKELENAHYHKWGIVKQQGNGGKPKPGQEFYGLKDTIKMLGHDKLEAIDLFKVDCEGCEWTSFYDWVDPEIPRLNQIIVDLHKPPQKIAIPFFDTLQAAGYVRTHKQINSQKYESAVIEYGFLKLEKDFFSPQKLHAPKRKTNKGTFTVYKHKIN